MTPHVRGFLLDSGFSCNENILIESFHLSGHTFRFRPLSLCVFLFRVNITQPQYLTLKFTKKGLKSEEEITHGARPLVMTPNLWCYWILVALHVGCFSSPFLFFFFLVDQGLEAFYFSEIRLDHWKGSLVLFVFLCREKGEGRWRWQVQRRESNRRGTKTTRGS